MPFVDILLAGPEEVRRVTSSFQVFGSEVVTHEPAFDRKNVRLIIGHDSGYNSSTAANLRLHPSDIEAEPETWMPTTPEERQALVHRLIPGIYNAAAAGIFEWLDVNGNAKASKISAAAVFLGLVLIASDRLKVVDTSYTLEQITIAAGGLFAGGGLNGLLAYDSPKIRRLRSGFLRFRSRELAKKIATDIHESFCTRSFDKQFGFPDS
jgi:hypothetical protein